jgi:hypothetical protein
MKMKKFILFLILLPLASLSVAQTQSNKKGKPRFAGLHFDFHAGLNDNTIGETFTYEMIDSLLSIVKPDFIQVDCKGHAGITSYPTKVGNTPATFSKDIMKIWREVTNKYGIPLFVHYSGVWDNRAIQLHPEWARINADSSRDKNAVSLLSGYTTQLLHPQLVELAKEYKLDGAWIDGDCWVLGNDYSPAVLAAFTAATGITNIPRKRTEPNYFEWMEFNRALFRKYITNYVDAAHAADPKFKITSNWSFSSMMPEKVDVPVDFLSGDVAGTNSLYSSAFESRCLALQGKPWDLMSWSFAWKNNLKATKSVPQMQQEAAEVLAMGGGFQTYWQQNRDGSPEPYQFRKMAEVIKFSNERKQYSFEANIVPQVGLLYSTYAWKRVPVTNLYSGHSQEAMKGNLNMLMDRQLSVDILMDHQLDGRLEEYPVIVLPEWEHIDPSIRTRLTEYVRNGGNLIVVGAQATRDFSETLGVNFLGKVQKDTAFFAGFNKETVILKTDFQPVQILKDTKSVGIQLKADDWRFPGTHPLATVRPLGKGKIAGIYMNEGSFYTKNKNPVISQLLKSLVETMDPRLMSKVTGSTQVHQVLARKNGKLYVHLINTSGPHDNPTVMVYDEVSPIHNVNVSIRLASTPKNVRLQPGNTKLQFTYKNGAVSVRVPELKIHSIVEIE